MNPKPTLPALLESYFTQRLMAQRQASPHTIASYRDTFRLLLNFAQKQCGKSPLQLEPYRSGCAFDQYVSRCAGKATRHRD
jgi:site-specific recombinase XerC